MKYIDQPSLTTPKPTLEQYSPIASTPTAGTLKSTPTYPFVPPFGFKEYQDSVAGVSVHIPESWVVIGAVDGQYAIFLSYPEDKYIGGEAFDPGDTKCDLNLHTVVTSMGDLIQQWKSNSLTTIVSEQDIVLQSGQLARKLVIDSMGRSMSLVAEIDRRVVVFTCFGDFALFDKIAFTLKASE
jgi:hypothetical protein